MEKRIPASRQSNYQIIFLSALSETERKSNKNKDKTISEFRAYTKEEGIYNMVLISQFVTQNKGNTVHSKAILHARHVGYNIL